MIDDRWEQYLQRLAAEASRLEFRIAERIDYAWRLGRGDGATGETPTRPMTTEQERAAYLRGYVEGALNQQEVGPERLRELIAHAEEAMSDE